MAPTRDMCRQTRNWIATVFDVVNKPTELPEGLTFLAFGEEVCPTTDRKHLQVFLQCKKKTTLKRISQQLRGLWGTPYYSPMKGNFEQNKDYCAKEGQYTTFGSFRQPMTGGEMEKQRWNRIRDLVVAHDYAALLEEFPREWLIHGQKWRDFSLPRPAAFSTPEPNYWIWGPPATGKTSRILLYCKKEGKTRYLKQKNYNWGGFNDQDFVVIDEISKPDRDGKHPWRGIHALKEWAQESPCCVSAKYEKDREINPRCIYVTSNYNIDTVFPPEVDLQLNIAIKRRFIELKFEVPFVYNDHKNPTNDWAEDKLDHEPFTEHLLPTKAVKRGLLEMTVDDRNKYECGIMKSSSQLKMSSGIKKPKMAKVE